MYRLQVSTAAPASPSIQFEWGYRLADLIKMMAILGMVLLVPILLVLWLRHLTLRNQHIDPTAAWFGYAHILNWISLGTWLVWIGTVFSLRVVDLNSFVLVSDTTVISNHAAIDLAILFFPPTPILVLCHILSYPVFSKVRGVEWTRSELAWQALLSQAATLLPLYCMLVGFSQLVQNAAAGCVWLAAAFISYVVVVKLLVKAMDLTPHALTVGELRDRVFGLAEAAGVKLQQLYVLPTGKGRMANAFAREGDSILLTDYLLQHLSKAEVDAVVAHELGHLKHQHPAKLAQLLLLGILVAGLFGGGASMFLPWQLPTPVTVILLVAGVYLVFYFISRRFEHVADAEAVALSGKPEAMITGLAKLMRLNQMPMDWGKWQESLSTHPSTIRRAQAIATNNGISSDRLHAILQLSETESDHYTLPTAADDSRIFSTSFKDNTLLTISWCLILVAVLVPAVAAWAAQIANLQGRAQTFAYISGGVLTPVIYLLVFNFIAVWGYNTLGQRLRRKFEQEGIDLTRSGNIFVGFAPGKHPRVYEGFSDWDVGYLVLTKNQLCYYGEQTRFALYRSQITAIHRVAGLPRWLQADRVCLTWRDDAQNTGGTFTLHPGDAPSLWHHKADIRRFGQKLQYWWEKPSGSIIAPSGLATLTTPAIGQVTSVTPRVAMSPRRWFNNLYFIIPLTIAVCTFLQLSWIDGCYILLVACLNIVVQAIPGWCYREP